METTTDQRTYTIDAAGKRLGHIATEAASILQGKDQTDFARHTVVNVVVQIENASHMDISNRRATEIYQSYSGYPGGRRTETLEHLAKRLGYKEVLTRTIKGMLPKNKLQQRRLAKLTITE